MRRAIRNRMALELAAELEHRARHRRRKLPGNRFALADASLMEQRAARLRAFAGRTA